jgi:hypothetical protein
LKRENLKSARRFGATALPNSRGAPRAHSSFSCGRDSRTGRQHQDHRAWEEGILFTWDAPNQISVFAGVVDFSKTNTKTSQGTDEEAHLASGWSFLVADQVRYIHSVGLFIAPGKVAIARKRKPRFATPLAQAAIEAHDKAIRERRELSVALS